MKMMKLLVEAEHAGRRLDLVAAELSGLTRSHVSNLIEDGSLLVNDRPPKQSYRVKAGDTITISVPHDQERLVAEDIPLEIVYMDDHLAVINKPPDMVVYPAAGHSGGTLMNALAYRSRKLASVGGPLRPGVVHRLDKDTSGVMVVALDDDCYYDLVEQFRARTIKRKYAAILYGDLKGAEGRISLKIGRSPSDRKKMSTKVRRGKEALTTWKVISRFPGATLIEAVLGTGRTHQIRVHFASIGHPVLGDRTYGRKCVLEIKKKKIFFPRQMLHAGLLGFVHPVSRSYMEFSRELPKDMKEKISELADPQ